MWTPRRILLLLLGLAGFTAAYLGYALVLGGVDGLPDLPAGYLVADHDADYVPPSADALSPTIVRLQEAFGPNSREVLDSIAYKTKIEDRDKGLVFACGLPTFGQEPSQFVTVAPFSLASFGKPKGPPRPGEVPEISTFHADKAVLEFDRKVSSPQDLTGGKAKLVGIELVSTPDLPSTDPRKGRVWVTNNQRSVDPNEALVFRTPGPLFYRAQDVATAPGAPHIWTAAAVEVTDLRNLPRKLRSDPLAAVASRADDLRGRNAVANILLGLTAPPPTITAEGLKIYLRPEDEGFGKKSGTGYSSVDAIELREKVQFNMWSDGGGGFPGTAGSEAPEAGDPPAATAALAGALADAATVLHKLDRKTLLVIDTLGPFRYDFGANAARFEAAPAPASQVTVSRLTAAGREDNLFCKELVIEFGDAADRPAGPSPAAGKSIKSLTATGEHVFVSVEAEQLLAQGRELRYQVGPDGKSSVTVLRGAPVHAVRERNHLTAGGTGTPAEVRIASADPPPGTAQKKRSDVAVIGPGTIKIFDPAANDNTLIATWGTTLTQERVSVGGQDQDLLKFEGGGQFEDAKGGMKLTADRLWLWLGAAEGTGPPTAGKSANPAAVKPQQLVATGRVTSFSPELMIRDTDKLTVWFRDDPTPAGPNRLAAKLPVPAPEPPAVAPTVRQVAAVEPLPAATPASPPKPTESQKVPLYLSAREISSWVVRRPQQGSELGGATASPPLKYELDRALCEDRVKVHQPPRDPVKSARGVDIFGHRLNLDQSSAGGVLTVTGTPDEWAKVFFEDVSLFGPEVVIDQPQNAVSVAGKGRLIMPGGSDVGGGAKPAGRPVDMKIDWTNEMRFNGAMATAEFVGRVLAVQQPRADDGAKPARAELAPPPRPRTPGQLTSRGHQRILPPTPADDTITQSVLACHRLDVTFDRPIYFNQAARDRSEGGRAKLRTAFCNPMPDDEAALVKRPDLLVPNVVFFEHVYGPGAVLLKAHRITAKQLEVRTDDRERLMDAAGLGEVRILQEGTKNSADPNPAPTADKAEDREMKLTVVNFKSRLRAKETRFETGFFQEATFDDGATVIQIPSSDLNRPVVEYDLPPRGVVLDCTDSLKVSTARTRKDAPAEQRMTAEGNARFLTDEYEGTAARIEYKDEATVLLGDRNGPARLQRRRRAGLNQQDNWSGERIVYNKDGTVTGDGTIDGSIMPGQ